MNATATLYQIKVDKHNTIRTTEIHEARAIAKQALVNRIKTKANQDVKLLSTHEKLYIHNNGSAQIRIYATLGHQYYQNMKHYYIAINCFPLSIGAYDTALHAEIFKNLYPKS